MTGFALGGMRAPDSDAHIRTGARIGADSPNGGALSGKVRNLLYLGRIESEKGILMLLDAFSAL